MSGKVFTMNARAPQQSARTMPLPVLASGQLHEVHAAGHDQAAALCFALSRSSGAGAAVLARMVRSGPLRANLQGDGLALLGIDPARLTLVEANSEIDVLRAGLEAARCPGVAMVLLEVRGRFAQYDLTASRRLALAAERSQACVVVLRHDAQPRASAAHTRWSITSAPSTPLEADAPGWPALAVELLRWRGGVADRQWLLQWDSKNGTFRDSISGAAGAALSGAVVPLPAVREDTGESRAA